MKPLTKIPEVIEKLAKTFIPIVVLSTSLMTNANAYQYHNNNINNSRNINYTISYQIPIQMPKQNEVQKALFLKEYISELKGLNDIINILIKNESFRTASKTLEMSVKNYKTPFSIEELKKLKEILNGEDGKSGYLKYVKDKYNDEYKAYLNGIYAGEQLFNFIGSKYINAVKNDIIKDLRKLAQALEKEENIKPYLLDIYKKLIFVFDNIKNDTKLLKKEGIIEDFNNKMINEYNLDKRWAQPNSNLDDVLNFIENGDPKYNITGLKNYLESLKVRDKYVISY